ncbi:MAG: hypothetical protein HZB24_04915 [Desulfobacterales bacterium]|nr:hypothetical protein [Desulfobacterales bacterium]
MKTGILSLGTRSDARTWEQQCQALGFDAPLPIKTSAPSLEQIKDFFRRPADWLYFGGHFIRPELYNEAHDVSVHFYADRVEIDAKGEKQVLRKGTEDFRLDSSFNAMFSGGGFIRRPFFVRVAENQTDPATCRDAWMGAALEGYGGGENEDRFAAVDPDGTLWTLENKKIKKGAKLF